MELYLMLLDARAVYEERVARALRQNQGAREPLFRPERHGGRLLRWLAALPTRRHRRALEETVTG